MSTRCTIEIRRRRGDEILRYKVYRHWDGYPEGVLADLYLVLNDTIRGKHYNISDPEYLLANLIFYAKLSDYVRDRGTKHSAFSMWEGGYGVCSPDCEHGDLSYKYTIEAGDGVLAPLVTIEKYDYDTEQFVTIFRGTLQEAFDKYVGAATEGCHVDRKLLEEIRREADIMGRLLEIDGMVDRTGDARELESLLDEVDALAAKGNLLENPYVAWLRDKIKAAFKAARATAR